MTPPARADRGFWTEELGAFFSWVLPRFSELRDAHGVRELWLQAEAARYFWHHRPDGPLPFRLNHRMAHRTRPDFACLAAEPDGNPVMGAELKVYYLNSFYKNLTGHSQKNSEALLADARTDEGRYLFTPELADRCSPREGSILKDYHRLVHLRAMSEHAGCLLMVLQVLDLEYGRDAKSGEPTTEFGEAVQKADFGGPGVVLAEQNNFRVTAWFVN